MKIFANGRLYDTKELFYNIEFSDDNCDKIAFIDLLGYIDKGRPDVHINRYFDKSIEDMENLMLEIACEKETYLIE